MDRIIAAHADPVDRNIAFNAAYQSFGTAIQQTLGADTLPNWFAVGAHASPQVGRSMLVVDRVVDGLELLKRHPNHYRRSDVFDAMELEGAQRTIAHAVAGAVEVAGASKAGATALAILTTLLLTAKDSGSWQGVLADPRIAVTTGLRLWELARVDEGVGGVLGTAWDALKGLFGRNEDAQDSKVLGRVALLASSYRSLLADANTAIFRDIGGSAEAFLRLRAANGGALTNKQVIADLHLPQSSARGAQRVYAWAKQQVNDPRTPSDFRGLARPGQGNDLVRAAFALYGDAGSAADPQEKARLVALANNLIAWREQAEVVDPRLNGERRGELDRAMLMHAVTPVVQLPIHDGAWTFFGYARRQPDRDGSPLTAQATEYNWAKFQDRWAPILDGFAYAYAHQDDVWRFPDPDVR